MTAHTLQSIFSSPLSIAITTLDFTLPTAINTPVAISLSNATLFGIGSYCYVTNTDNTKWMVFKVTAKSASAITVVLESLTDKAGVGSVASGSKVYLAGKSGTNGSGGITPTITIGTVITGDPESSVVITDTDVTPQGATFNFTIPSGSVWRSGADVPLNATGRNNDYYLRTGNGDVYKRTTGTYTVVANMKGAMGSGIAPRGTWSSGTAYVIADGVIYQGSLYVALTANTNKAPDDFVSDWTLYVSQGDTGATGAAGAAGAAGSVWRTGSGVPNNALGVNNDYYLNVATSDVYLKASDAYSIVANIKGQQGIQGNDGTGLAGENATLTKTSTTTRDIGIGSKTFAYTSTNNLGWVAGATRLRVAYNSSNYMEGMITLVSTTSVTILSDYAVGSGTWALWELVVTGERGESWRSVSTKTSNYTAVDLDKIPVNTTTGNFTITLPSAGKIWLIDIISSSPTTGWSAVGKHLTIQPASGSQTIMGGANFTINTGYCYQFELFGTEWRIIMRG